MKIAIIGAMEEEVQLMSSRLTNKTKVEKCGFVFEVGRYANHDIILTVSKIGKVAAGMLMGVLASEFEEIDKIINIGVAGGVLGKTKPGEVVLSTRLSYADADARGFNYQYGQIPRCPLYFEADKTLIEKVESFCFKGVILTADVFQTKKDVVDEIVGNYFNDQEVMCFDMESTAFAQCAYRLNVGFLAIRAISDVIGADNQLEKYENSLEMACEKADNILCEILNKL